MAIYKVTIKTSVTEKRGELQYSEIMGVVLMDSIRIYMDPRLDIVFFEIQKNGVMVRTVLVQLDDTGIPDPGPEELLVEKKVAMDMGKKLIKEHLGIKSNDLYFLRG